MGLALAFQACANPNLTEAAKQLGITVQQLHSLEAKFNLSDQELLALPRFQLQTLLWDATHPGIDKHAEAQNQRVLQMMDEHGKIPPDGLVRALTHRRHNGVDSDLFPAPPDPSPVEPTFGTRGPLFAGLGINSWTWLGPGNVGGRVRSILVHPTLTNILWCGGVDGGVWKTTNSGGAWFPLDDFMANLAVASMALDPTNPDILYAGTGEGTYNLDAIRGAGIFKSADGGSIWAQLDSTTNYSFQYVSRLAIDPTNGQVILAATRAGIYRSADGGSSWSQTLGTEALDVAFDPKDSAQSIASGYNGSAFFSTNGGQTWSGAAGLPAPAGFVMGRVELAYSRSNPQIVYASVDNNNGELYRSTDGGRSYTLRNTGNNFLGSQGWYGNSIWADPTSTNIVIVGGIDLWRTTDGGATLSRISQWQSAPNSSAHADHHVIVSHPAFNGTSVRTVFFGNDGGIYQAADVYAVSLTSGWQALNNNLGITQFYGGAGNSNTTVVIGGAQDNGTLRYTTNGGTGGWTTMFNGDGGFAAADQTDPNYFYGEYVYLQIHRSTDGGATANYIFSGIADAGNPSINFISPFILDPNNPKTMLAGGLSLWRSTNVKAVSPSWEAIKGPIGSPISAIAVAPGNSDMVWVGHNNGQVYYATNGTAGSPTWIRADPGTPNLPVRYCTRIAIAPGNLNRVYVTFGGFSPDNVWMTPDNGLTWSNITANLPVAPVRSIVVTPTDPNTLYVGTEVGVYGTSNGGGVWSGGNDGPANVAVDELFWLGNKLVAVAHGRGMFCITPPLGGPNLAAAGDVVSGGNGNGIVDPNECNLINLLVENTGGATASNVTAVLTTTTPGVSVLRGTSTYPDLLFQAVGTNLTPFQISTSPSFTCGQPIALTLAVAFAGGTNMLRFNLPVGTNSFTVTATTGASIVPGTTDTGNHGDDSVTTIALPFVFRFYGQLFSNATLSANGNLQFLSGDNNWDNICLPYNGFNYAILPFWDDLRTDAAGSGIFRSISGNAPDRIFNLEWRATYYSSGNPLNFEVRLYEDQPRFDIIYGALNGNGSSATVGAQQAAGASYSLFECNAGGLTNGLQISFQQFCADGGGQCPVTLAGFSASPTSGAAPLTVSFTNLSDGATNYYWDFGDSNSATNADPEKTYTNAGNYTVTLTAIGPGGTNSLSQTNYIVVTNPPPAEVVADFAAAPTNGVAPLFVSFTNLSSGTTSYIWDFGDGNSAINTNPANIYTNAGSYTVTLTAIGPGGTNTLSQTNYIFVTNPPPPMVVADFAAMPSNGIAPLLVSFTNLSSGATSYIWDFGDGNLATNTNPDNIYTNAGSYTVTLTAIGPGSTNTLSQTNYIFVTNPPPPAVVADFAAAPTNGVAPLLVSFTNLSSGATAYIWDFGDGNLATNADPANIYTNAGSYTVTLTAIGPGGSNTVSQTNYIVLTNPPPPMVVADFAAAPTSGVAPLLVSFTNLSSGATAYIWDFGDGNSATNADPANTYINAGSYTVTLTAIGPGGSNSLSQTNYIIVTNPPPPVVVADFDAATTNGVAPLLVSFTNLSSGATAYIWDFGDGNSATNTNPENIYTNAGSYTVTLTGIGPGGTNFLSQTNYIVVTNPPPAVVADFVAAPTNGVAPLLVFFTNVSSGATTYTWDFGDGNSATNANPVNTYSNAGIYSVTLTAIGPGGTNSLNLTNSVLVLAPPVLVALPTTLDFGLISTGATITASLLVSNAGAATLTGTAGIEPGSFSLDSDASFTIGAAMWTNLSITFMPASQGVFSNLLTFASNGGAAINTLVGRALNTPLLLAPAFDGASFTFSFLTVVGFSYQIQYTDSLTDPVWQPLQSVAGDGTVQTITVSASGASERFYRLSVR